MNHTEEIRRLEAKLKEAKAKASKQIRTERNGQLVSLGIMFEQHWKDFTPDEKATWIHRALGLDERNRSRVKAAFLRLSPAPPADATTPQEESKENPPAHSGLAD